MRSKRHADSAARGYMRAAQRGGGFAHPEHEEILREFRYLNTPEARGAFADKWIRLISPRMNTTWVVLYEMLAVVRDQQLYRQAELMEDKRPRETFEAYWADVLQKPFATWLELENTYHFVTQNAPQLMKGTLGEAVAGVQAIAEAARDIGPNGVRLAEARVSDIADRAAEMSVHGNGDRCTSCVTRGAPSLGANTDSDYYTARIKRDRPDILERMKAGEFRSVRAAALEAGIIKPRGSCPIHSPEAAADWIARHFKGERLALLIQQLAKHVDY